MCERIPITVHSQESGSANHCRLALLEGFASLFGRLRPCFAQDRTFDRAMMMASAMLCSDAPHTITSAIIAAGEQNDDWTSYYNLFSHAKWQGDEIFGVVLDEAERHFKHDGPIPIAIDEGHLPKWGKKIPGTALLRDPHSPAYRANLHWAQRYIQGSALISPEGIDGPSRGIPVSFQIAPAAKRPRKRATEEEKAQYRLESKEKSISKYCVRLMAALSCRLGRSGAACQRGLAFAVDGSFTNKTVMRNLPERSVLIGRVRKDIALYDLPREYSGFGRRRKYGDRLATPEGIRQSGTIPWCDTELFAAGKKHTVRYKCIPKVLWKDVTQAKPVTLIVIEPLAYRPSKGAKLLYRQPAYLIVTDPDMLPEVAIRTYFRRWEIEVNHREEKSIMGVGQAQVRNGKSAYNVPQFVVAVYGLLLLASLNAYGPNRTDAYLPYPKWRNDERPRPSATDLRRQYQRELQQAGANTFQGFVVWEPLERRARKCQGLLSELTNREIETSVFCATRDTSPASEQPN